MPTNNDHTPEQEEFSRLINDLRTMPRVKAASNFDYLLEQKILESQKPKEAWWKRFFLSGFKIGGFRVPVYAYGPVAAVLVVFLGIYVYNVTNFESQLSDMSADQTFEQPQIPQQPQVSQPQEPQSPSGVASPNMSGDEDRASTNEGQLRPEPGNAIQNAPTAPKQGPVPTPDPIPSDIEKQPATRGLGAGSKAPTDMEGMRESTRGMPDTYTPKKESKAAEEEELRNKSKDDLNEADGAAAAKPASPLQKDAKKIMDSRQYMMMSISSQRDSVRILDSLRRLDSLRNLNKQR